MSTGQPHLELRPTGYYWRRRLPASLKKLLPKEVKPPPLCFPLKTKDRLQAARIARSLTALSEICFAAEIDMPPEVMTHLLVSYARLEIETADRLRALTGPRTRTAAETALAIEAELRASLREAILHCDHSAAVDPVKLTAERLGIEINEEEDDYAILCDKMLRMQIELSEEREKRTKGHFSEKQPYLGMALSGLHTCVEAPAPTNEPASAHVSVPTTNTSESATPAAAEGHTLERAVESVDTDVAPPDAEDLDEPLLDQDGLTVRFRTRSDASTADVADPSGPRLLDLWDAWLEHGSKGASHSQAYDLTDQALGERFDKNGDTIAATRRIVADVFGNRPVNEISEDDWQRFNNLLHKLPTGHGKSTADKALSAAKIVAQADEKQRKQVAAANKTIASKNLDGDEKEEILRNAKIKRLSPRTVQRHERTLSRVLDFAVFSGKLVCNPYKEFVMNDKVLNTLLSVREDTSRLLWHDEFQEMLATEKWNSQKTAIDDPIYWMPLLARLSGLRSEEALQLKPSDIRSDEGIWYIIVQKGTGQSVKSQNARRHIPLHSQLIELGFLELVKRQRRLQKKRIFAKVNRGKTKKLSFTSTYTKKFTYYRKSRGLYEARRDHHALRTTFNTACVKRKMPDTARRYLMGHQNPDVGIRNYLPEGFPLETLKELIELDRIDLSMVTRRFGVDEPRRRGPRLATNNGENLRQRDKEPRDERLENRAYA